jgi:hypothetical protein
MQRLRAVAVIVFFYVVVVWIASLVGISIAFA